MPGHLISTVRRLLLLQPLQQHLSRLLVVRAGGRRHARASRPGAGQRVRSPAGPVLPAGRGPGLRRRRQCERARLGRVRGPTGRELPPARLDVCGQGRSCRGGVSSRPPPTRSPPPLPCRFTLTTATRRTVGATLWTSTRCSPSAASPTCKFSWIRWWTRWLRPWVHAVRPTWPYRERWEPPSSSIRTSGPRSRTR